VRYLCSWPQQAFSNQWCALLPASLLDCKGLVPLKWMGHPHTAALAEAKWACVHPCLGHLAVLHHICTCPLVAAPWGFVPSVRLLHSHALHLLGSSASVHSPLPSLNSILGTLLWQSLNFTPGHALHPGYQYLGLSSPGSLSLTSGFNAGSPLGQG